MRPHSKRERRRSSISGISLGGESRGDDDLLPRLVEVVERVEELLLRALLAGDELDVVDQEEVDRAVLGAELRGAVVADGVDEIVREALGGEVEQAERRVQARDLVTDRVEEVRLAEADTAVDEERVVGLRRQLGDRLAGGLGELVGVADHEGLEGVAGREAVGERHRRRLAGGHGAALGLAIDLDGNHRDCRPGPSARRTGAPRCSAARASRGCTCWARPTRMRSPSIAVTRQGRSQESMAVSGIFPSIVARSTGPQRIKHCQALVRRRRKKLHTELSTGVDNREHSGGPGFRERNERGPGRDVSSIPSNTGQALHAQHRAPRLRAGGDPTIAACAVARPLRTLTWSRAVRRLRWFFHPEGSFHEEDVSTQCAPAQEDARISLADEDAGRAEGPEAAARKGTQAPHRLAKHTVAKAPAASALPRGERLRRAAEFQAVFQRGSRHERPSFVALWRRGGAVGVWASR